MTGFRQGSESCPRSALTPTGDWNLESILIARKLVPALINYHATSRLIFFLSSFLPPHQRVQGIVSTMPFDGKGNLLHLNTEQFDFNLQFESLFFSILPSVLFIPSSLWRTLAQIRKPVVVNAPVFHLIKTVCP
jgi:hypothetical protein